MNWTSGVIDRAGGC